MRSLLGAALVGLALSSSWVACAKAEGKISGSIELRHVGDEDHPIFTIILQTEPSRAPDAALDRIHRFLVPMGFFAAALRYVVSVAAAHPTKLVRAPRRGAFEVKWNTANGSGRYFVLSDNSCSFLESFLRVMIGASSTEKAATAAVGDVAQTGRYVGCKEGVFLQE